MHPRWAEGVPDAATWRPPRGRSLQESTREQDEAAGGRARRLVELDGGSPATASVELKLLPKSRRVYAYLRYARDGRTANVYIGQVEGVFRMADGSHAMDRSAAYVVIIDEERIPELEELLRAFKARTTQEAIYLEIQHGVEFRLFNLEDAHDDQGGTRSRNPFGPRD